jgi:hypothetical protein
LSITLNPIVDWSETLPKDSRGIVLC